MHNGYEQSASPKGNFRWYRIAGGITLLGLVGAALQLLNDYPSIADIYRPAVAGIERMERKKVPHNKGWKWLDFYYASYPAYDVRFPTSFATDTGMYRVGDSVWVLYDPEKPETNVVYARRSGAIHLPSGVNMQEVSLDYEGVVRLFDSIEAERRVEAGE